MRPFVKSAAWAGIITALAAAVNIASFMRFSIPEWSAVFVMPALAGITLTVFLDLEPTRAFRCRQTSHRMYSRSSSGGERSRWSCALAAVGGVSQLARAHTGSRVRNDYSDVLQGIEPCQRIRPEDDKVCFQPHLDCAGAFLDSQQCG